MADVKNSNILFSLSEESTAGTPAAVSASDFLELTEDGATVDGSLEKMDTNTMNGDRFARKSKKTTQNGTFSGALYARCNVSVGAAPEMDLLLRMLGLQKETVGTTTDLLTGSTTSVLNVASGDELKYKIGQTILLDNQFKCVISGLADGEISILFPLDNAPASGLVVSKLVAYRFKEGVSASATVRKWYAGKVKRQVPGSRCGEMSSTWTAGAGAVPFSFSGEGINFSEVVEVLGVNPAFSSAEYPAAIGSCARVHDGTAEVDQESNEISFTLSNALNKKPTLCATNTNKAINHNERPSVSGSLSTYLDDGSVTMLPSDSYYSIHSALNIPTNSIGGQSNIIAAFFPRIKIDENSEGNINGATSRSKKWMLEQRPMNDNDCFVLTFI